VTFNDSVDAVALSYWYGMVFSNLTFYPQLEAGSTATEYEPYTGGKPSPSPDYPQEIKVCRGRNLLDEQWELGSINSVGGLVITTANMRCKNIIPITAGSQYVYYQKEASTEIWANYYAGTTFLSREKFASNARTGAFTAPSNANGVKIRVTLATDSVLNTETQLELGSTPTPYVPFGHVGLEVQGRNVLPIVPAGKTTVNGVTFESYGNGKFRIYGTTGSSSSSTRLEFEKPFFTGSACVIHLRNESTSTNAQLVLDAADGGNGMTIMPSPLNRIYRGSTILNRWYKNIGFFVTSNTVIDITLTPSIEATEEVTDYATGFAHETRAIPLPLKSDGERWAGGLPDGTADVLAIDSAGRWEWAAPMKFTTQAVTDGVSGTVGVDVMSSTGQIADGATVLYASTSTPEHGYIDLPDVSEGATIDIPELREVGVRCFVHGARELAEHAANWGKRALESESRIAALEAAVAELATS
jgi:hypothetical protein